MTKAITHILPSTATAQEVYNFVIAHLRKQGKQAKKADACEYHAPDGTMCAVGCLIPDELYTRDLEGAVVGDFVNLFTPTDDQPKWRVAAIKLGKKLPLFKRHHRLLAELQGLHDNENNWAEDGFNDTGEEQIHYIAASFNLIPA